MEKYKSLHYSLILDDIGFSEKRIQSTRAFLGNLNKVCRFMKLPGTHMTGSWAEGLGPLLVDCNMKTDLDLMLVTWEAGYNDDSMRVHSSDENPGFVKLETCNQDLPLTRKYGKNFVSSIEFHVAVSSCFSCVMNSQMLKSTFFNIFLETLSKFIEFDKELSHQQGPAFAATFKNPVLFFGGPMIEKIDIVITVECPEWPTVAREWIVRKRHFNWPSKSLIDKCVKNGCLLVPVGNKESPDEHIEWRISFSLVERNLFWSLNPTQYKCFAILKCILTYILKPKFQDAITSFIMKNVLFWTVEQTDPEFWREENLIQCTTTCLKTVYKWVREDRCPHYIIPGNNILKNRYDASEKEQILHVLGNILKDFTGSVEIIPPFKNRLSLQKNITIKIEGVSVCSGYSTSQQTECCDLETESNTLEEEDFTMHGLHDNSEDIPISKLGKKNDIELDADLIVPMALFIIIQEFLSYRVMLKVSNCDSISFAFEWINKHFIYCHFLQVPLVRYFVSKLLSFQMLLVLQLPTRSYNKKQYAVLTLLRTIEKIRKTFPFVLEPAPSSQITLIYFYLFRTPKALVILNKMVNLYRSCGYPKTLGFVSDNDFKRASDMLDEKTTENFIIILDHYFTTKEVNIMPFEMQIEIIINSLEETYRKSIPESVSSEVFEPFFKILFWSKKNPTPVDPLVFASYLQFKCYQRLNIARGKMLAIDNLEWFSSHPCSKYKYVSYNLLGHCYFQTSDLKKALGAFSKSMKHSKDQTASIWHLAFILHKLFRQENHSI